MRKIVCPLGPRAMKCPGARTASRRSWSRRSRFKEKLRICMSRDAGVIVGQGGQQPRTKGQSRPRAREISLKIGCLGYFPGKFLWPCPLNWLQMLSCSFTTFYGYFSTHALIPNRILLILKLQFPSHKHNRFSCIACKARFSK